MGIGHVLGGGGIPPVLAQARGGAVSNGLLNALIAYWPGNEASGNALDLHTNALHLTQFNNPGSNTGIVYALAREYNRVLLQRHMRASEALLQTGDVDFTIATWVYIGANNTQFAVSKSGNNIATGEYYLENNSGVSRLRFRVNSGGGIGTATANTYGVPALATWIFVVCWHDSVVNTVNIQVNDGGVDSVAFALGVTTTADSFAIASSSGGGNAWEGRIGPTAFWKSAAGGGGVLTADQRTALYNAGAGLAYAAFTT